MREIFIKMIKTLSMAKKFFGFDLATRDIQLDFKIPKISNRVKASEVFISSFNSKIKKSEENSLEFFSLLKIRIKHINRCSLSIRQRLNLTREILHFFHPRALEEMSRQSRFGEIPEQKERKTILNLISDICEIIYISYQIIFCKYYCGNNFFYARCKERVFESAIKIIEMIALKQQTRALRYQLLDGQDWKTANTIFYVMSVYEDVEKTTRVLNEQSGKYNTKSLRELYTALHMVARFDPLKWPTHLQWIIKSYMNGIPKAVTVETLDHNEKSGRDILASHCYSEDCANLPQLAALSEKVFALNCSIFFGAVRQDCFNLIKAIKSNNANEIPARFKNYDQSERLAISEQLLNGLESSTPKISYTIDSLVHDLRIFVGFSEVFALLQHRQSEFRSEERLTDALAKRSAIIAEDQHATDNSVWSLQFKNGNMTRLSTRESSYTTRMSIGSLLAYGIGEAINKLRLAVVSRISRSSGKSVTIDIEDIANYAEAAIVSIDTFGNNQRKRAIMVQDNLSSDKWGVILKPIDIIYGFDRFSLHRNGEISPLSIENIRRATTDFSLFSTAMRSTSFEISEEPAYALDTQAS